MKERVKLESKQKIEMLKKIKYLKRMYPRAEVIGHRDFPGVKKDCPSFDVKEWLKYCGVDY